MIPNILSLYPCSRGGESEIKDPLKQGKKKNTKVKVLSFQWEEENEHILKLVVVLIFSRYFYYSLSP